MQWLLAECFATKTPFTLYASTYSGPEAACKRGHAEMVNILLTAGGNPLITNQARTLALIASETNRWDIVKIIVNHATLPGVASPTYADKLDYNSILQQAVDRVDIDISIITALFKLGGSHNIKLKNQDNLLQWAITKNHLELIKQVIEAGADLEETNNDKTAIELAAEYQRWDVVKLIANAKKTTTEDKARFGKALLWAVEYGQLEVATCLVAANTSIHQIYSNTGYNLLGTAIARRDATMTQFLLEWGADPDDTNKMANTVLTVFDLLNKLEPPSTEIRALFAKYMENDVTGRLGYSYKTLQVRKRILLDDDPQVVDHLSGIPADWIMPDKGGTFLHWAITCYRPKIIKHFLRNNPPLLTTNREGLTPIQFAARLKSWDIVKIIAQHKKTDREDKAGYGLALLWALDAVADKPEGMITTVVILIAAGATASADRIADNRRTLHWAIHYKNLQLLKLLLQHGADLTLGNEAGRTPIQFAFAFKKRRIR